MTSDMIEIWTGILGLAYLVAAGLYSEMLRARKDVPARRGHARPVRIRRSR
ncbi:hypothetical protein MPLA_830039 [Mesorhizobium sp. ORS 3359]|nr:hypothetical protein MPLA_830039 [Mesorhizobium sp. ORS 3359]